MSASLRQRRGEPQGRCEKSGVALTDNDQEMRSSYEQSLMYRSLDRAKTVNKREMAKDMIEMLSKSIPQPTKGLSDEAMHWRSQLADDPYNMHFIFHLGLTYAQDRQWEKSCNTLMRGWKRMDEVEDAEVRFHFLLCLAEASLKSAKSKQALAVLNTIEEPQDVELKTQYEVLRCLVYSENGDKQRALQALSCAFESKTFTEALKIWATCLAPLAKVGALDVSRGTVLALASTDDERTQVDAVAKMALVRHGLEQCKAPTPRTVRQKVMLTAVAVVGSLFLLYILYIAESANLTRLQSSV